MVSKLTASGARNKQNIYVNDNSCTDLTDAQKSTPMLMFRSLKCAIIFDHMCTNVTSCSQDSYIDVTDEGPV